jgi:hypothetical protein
MLWHAFLSLGRRVFPLLFCLLALVDPKPRPAKKTESLRMVALQTRPSLITIMLTNGCLYLPHSGLPVLTD